ncbi:protein serine/threonine phosphatase 2C [Macrolepiota fuliginosa MF-IS2]|uniref:Protein serine/threonine phosphatase 2C n=1 Tax=Macrolepiota fuliginosa MF-IS2 TaxID=1400762 RepID=A0A9P5X6K9_9AGAR|nr:protein serine/threonine phosphatase 2C [Macrolepiota fuliginosa MF-IS2]
MLKTCIRNYRPKPRRLDDISSFIGSSSSPLYIHPLRRLHTPPPRHQSRRGYASILCGFASTALLCGLALCASKWEALVPFGTIHADADVDDSAEASETKKEDGPKDYTTCAPPSYYREFWEMGSKTLEEYLSHSSEIYKVDTPCGVPRYDVSVVGSGSITTCLSSASFIELPSHYWVIFGIYDGHNGNQVASHLANHLRHSIMGTLVDLYSKHAILSDAHIDLGGSPDYTDYWYGALGRPYPPAEEFDVAVKQGFTNVDKEIVEEASERALDAAKRHENAEPQQENLLSYPDAAGLVARAYAGSSALVAVYESDTRQLRMANTGDSRAVLGRRLVNDRGEESYEVHVLTHDMAVPSGFIDDPPKRIQKPTHLVHAFGDGPWKWSEERRQQLSDAFPFIISHEKPFAPASAEPVITTIETRPGDFLVMASQGFWSSLTNEEAVGLVGLWLKKHRRYVFGDREPEDKDVVSIYDPETSSVVPSPQRVPVAALTRSFLRKDVFEREDLPVQFAGENDETFMYRFWSSPKKFVNVDRNVAQHLVRNAIGGANQDVMEALLRMGVPKSRQYRNDVSVEVVFFA